ncbi:MAG: TRAP transporter permease [Bifidobacteriaceae bacterium]|jgi:TRAP transporter 4TM/12TM fusion protein|nr:TRAP transporter permease [Bifidobacteriaceae bacterium]
MSLEAKAVQPAFETVAEDQVQEVLEKVDKEAKTRRFRSAPVGWLFYGLCVAVSLYHLWSAIRGPLPTHQSRSIHVGLMLVLGFFLYPMFARSSRQTVAWYDWLLMAASAAVPVYFLADYAGIIDRFGSPSQLDTIVSTVLVVLVLEGARRVTGWALPILCLVFIIYGLFGGGLPGVFWHRGYDWSALANVFINTEGIFGTAVAVSSTYIFLFILFGAFMAKSGMGQFFNDFAMAAAGSARGGPAKVAVISSGLLGSINGSAVANVVTTGAFTIPLMKRCGYPKVFAGAVEASASVGGQLLPPIMGAAAFIMAETIGVPYSQIVIWAVIPALLYYLGVLTQVHLRAAKLGLDGVPRDRLPAIRTVMAERGHLLIPIVFLVYMLFFSGLTVILSAVLTIGLTVLVAQCRRATRMSVKDIFDALADGARQTVPVAVACAAVGIIVGVLAKTGLATNLSRAMISMGDTSVLLTLFMAMVTCMVLGMGVPSIPAYIITATMASQVLEGLGIPTAAAHMFAFYFAMFANITPPVALASFAAAGLSGGDPMKTGIASFKLSLAGFIVPYMFVFAPALMLIDTTWHQALWVTVTACLGVVLIGVAVEGFLFARVPPWLRLLVGGAALGLLHAGLWTDLVGLVVLVGLVAFQRIRLRRSAAPARVPS